MKHYRRSWVLAALAALVALPTFAASVEVKLQLPQRARLNLQGKSSIAVAPFLVVTQEGADRLQRGENDAFSFARIERTFRAALEENGFRAEAYEDVLRLYEKWVRTGSRCGSPASTKPSASCVRASR